MCQSSGIIKAWSWSICVGKIGLAGQSQERKTSRPWISWRRSGSTWRILRKSRLWHFFASIQLIELPPRLDACIAKHVLCICVFFAFWFQQVYHNLLQEQQFQQGKTKATRSPTSTERAAQPSSEWWSWRAASGDGRLMTSLSSRWRRRFPRKHVMSWRWRSGRMSRSWPAECCGYERQAQVEFEYLPTCQFHPLVGANIASPAQCWSAPNSGKTERSQLVNVGLDSSRIFSFEACGIVAEGLSSIPFETETIPGSSRLPAEVGISLRYLPLLSKCFELPEAPDGAMALGGLLWSGWLGLAGWFEDVSNLL